MTETELKILKDMILWHMEEIKRLQEMYRKETGKNYIGIKGE